MFPGRSDVVWVETWLNNDDNDEYCLMMVGIY